MEQRGRWVGGVGRAAVWTLSALIAVGLAIAGAGKFAPGSQWQALFVGWGYPAWFAGVIGALEVVGAVGLLVPGVARYAAPALATIMAGALFTLLTHPGGKMGWGAVPLVYLVLLVAIAIVGGGGRARPPPPPTT